MDTLVQSNLYLIFVVAGGVFVSLRARTLFNVALIDQGSHRLLAQFELQDLCSKQRYTAGLLTYLVPILLVYLLLAVSPDLLAISMSITGTNPTIGAMSLNSSQAQTFAPILAAVAVTTLLGIKSFSLFEHSLRNFSHGIADVPHHFQQLLRHIQEAGPSEISRDDAPLDLRSKSLWDLPLIGDDIRAIQIFNKWTIGRIGESFWTDRSAALLAKAKPEIQLEYNSFMHRLELRKDSIFSTDHADTDRMEDDRADKEVAGIVELARTLRMQYTKLLAVAITNETTPQKPDICPESLWNYILHARSNLESSRLTTVLVASILNTFVICLSFSFVMYLSLSTSSSLQQAIYTLDNSERQLLVNSIPMWDFYVACLMASLGTAIWDTSGLCLIFLFGCGAGISYRASLVKKAEWLYRHEGHYPVTQYSIVALLATANAALPYLVFLFIKLVVWPAAMIPVPTHFASMLRDFSSGFLPFGFMCLLAAPAAILICLLSDRLENRQEKAKTSDRSTISMVIWFSLTAGIFIPTFVRFYIADVTDPTLTLLNMVLPVLTMAVLASSFWIIGFNKVSARNSLEHPWPRWRAEQKTTTSEQQKTNSQASSEVASETRETISITARKANA